MAKTNSGASQKNAVPTEVTENKQAEKVTTQETSLHETQEEGKKPVRFIVPWKRYSRGDIAVFLTSTANTLVERGAAEWLDGKAKKPNAGDDDNHETDIG